MKPFVLFVFFVSLARYAASDDRVENLPEKYRVWLEEEVTYIISDVERETFLDLEGGQEFAAFIEAFWRKRDTNPTTIENEFREEYDARLTYVNKFFGRDTFRPGWMTDRGRYFLILGPPAERQNHEGFDDIYPSVLWFYNNPELKRYALPPFFYLLFFRRGGFGELELYSPVTDGPQALLTGYQTVSMDFRQDVERAYDKLYEISPELAHAALSFRTDEGDTAQFQTPAFGTISLLDGIASAPFRGIDTSYADGFDSDSVETDYLFSYVPSSSMAHLLPGPGQAHYLHWVIEVDAQNVALVKDDERGLYGSVFILSAEVVSRENPNHVVFDARKESFMNLREAQIGSALSMPFAHSGVFPLVPGSYDVRIVWRNRACASTIESDCRKAYTFFEIPVRVPEWESEKPALTDIVLAYGTERPEGAPAYKAYRFGNLEILPNAKRVYALGDSLVVMGEARGAGEGHQLRFRLVNLEQQQKIALEKTVPAGGMRLEPLLQEFSLSGLTAGRYRLVVDLLSGDGANLDRRSEDFDISPRTLVVRPGVRGSWSEITPEIPGMVEMALGQQYLNLGQKDKARELFESSFAANPRMPPVRESLASLMLEEDDFEGAVELLEPVYRFTPDRYGALAMLGEAYFKQEEYARAAEILEKAVALRRPEARLLNFLAISHHRLGDTDRAIELLDRSLSHEPDQAEVQELLEKLRP